MFRTIITFIKGLFSMSIAPQNETPEAPEKEEREIPLGTVSAKYESGGLGPDTISDGHGDPGGKSYGIYQLSYKAGTLQKYLRWDKTYGEIFRGETLTSESFDSIWVGLALEDPEFAVSQKQFIIETHYNPALRTAKLAGFATSHVAIQEAIFSISVQHGSYKTIIGNANYDRRGDNVKRQVEALYRSRIEYVTSLHSLTTRLKEILLDRYEREIEDVMWLV